MVQAQRVVALLLLVDDRLSQHGALTVFTTTGSSTRCLGLDGGVPKGGEGNYMHLTFAAVRSEVTGVVVATANVVFIHVEGDVKALDLLEFQGPHLLGAELAGILE